MTGEARDGGFYLSVNVDQPLPEALHGIAGLNMEFMPPVFFGHSYIIDGKHGLFPTSPADFMTTINGEVEPTPMATGKLIDIAPDEPLKHITIRTTDDNNLSCLNGRNKQQNGNFVVRTLLPAGKDRQDSRMAYHSGDPIRLGAQTRSELLTSRLPPHTKESGRSGTG